MSATSAAHLVNFGIWSCEVTNHSSCSMSPDRLDLIGFGSVSIALNNGNGTFKAPKLVIEDFVLRRVASPRFIADLTGNKAGDVVGFGNNGEYVATNRGDGAFQPVKKVIDDFAYDAGDLRVAKHLRFLVDLTGNGCVDLEIV